MRTESWPMIPGGSLTIDVDRRDGFVDGSQALGHHESGQHGGEHERQNLPALPPENPQVVRKRNGWFFGLGLLLRRGVGA